MGAGRDRGIVDQTGRNQGTRYFVKPALVREAGMDLRTLNRVQPHRLRALILEDLERYPDSSSAEIHRRIGPEIARRTFSRALKDLTDDGAGVQQGTGRWTRYQAKLLSATDITVADRPLAYRTGSAPLTPYPIGHFTRQPMRHLAVAVT